jgi:hypothetical protein
VSHTLKVGENLICANGNYFQWKPSRILAANHSWDVLSIGIAQLHVYTHCIKQKALQTLKAIGKMKSNNYHNFHHRYDANTEHNKDPEAKLTCIVNVDRSIGNGQKKTEKTNNNDLSICENRSYIGHQCSCNLWYSIAVWPSISSTKLPWRKLQSHL